MTVPSSMLGGHRREKIGEREKKKAWCGSALRFLWRELRGMAIQLFRSMLLGEWMYVGAVGTLGYCTIKYWGQKYSIRA